MFRPRPTGGKICGGRSNAWHRGSSFSGGAWKVGLSPHHSRTMTKYNVFAYENRDTDTMEEDKKIGGESLRTKQSVDVVCLHVCTHAGTCICRCGRSKANRTRLQESIFMFEISRNVSHGRFSVHSHLAGVRLWQGQWRHCRTRINSSFYVCC